MIATAPTQPSNINGSRLLPKRGPNPGNHFLILSRGQRPSEGDFFQPDTGPAELREWREADATPDAEYVDCTGRDEHGNLWCRNRDSQPLFDFGDYTPDTSNCYWRSTRPGDDAVFRAGSPEALQAWAADSVLVERGQLATPNSRLHPYVRCRSRSDLVLINVYADPASRSQKPLFKSGSHVVAPSQCRISHALFSGWRTRPNTTRPRHGIVEEVIPPYCVPKAPRSTFASTRKYPGSRYSYLVRLTGGSRIWIQEDLLFGPDQAWTSEALRSALYERHGLTPPEAPEVSEASKNPSAPAPAEATPTEPTPAQPRNGLVELPSAPRTKKAATLIVRLADEATRALDAERIEEAKRLLGIRRRILEGQTALHDALGIVMELQALDLLD